MEVKSPAGPVTTWTADLPFNPVFPAVTDAYHAAPGTCGFSARLTESDGFFASSADTVTLDFNPSSGPETAWLPLVPALSLAETSLAVPAVYPAISSQVGSSRVHSGFLSRAFFWGAGNLSKMEMLLINSTLSLGAATLLRVAPDALALGVADLAPELADSVFNLDGINFDWFTATGLALKWKNYMLASFFISLAFNGQSALTNAWSLDKIDRGFRNVTGLAPDNPVSRATSWLRGQKQLSPDELVMSSFSASLRYNGLLGCIRKIGLTLKQSHERGSVALMSAADFVINTGISWIFALFFEPTFALLTMLGRSSLITTFQVWAHSVVGGNRRFPDAEVQMHRTEFGIEKGGVLSGVSASTALPDWAKVAAQFVAGGFMVYRARKAVREDSERNLS